MKTTQKQPNPQGKGVVQSIALWNSYRPVSIKEKPIQKLLSDYVASLLVLSADFRFKPVKGVVYFLYLKKQRWTLSLIEPRRWSYQKSGAYFGSCELQEDMTWAITIDQAAPSYPDISHALTTFYHQMTAHLDSDEPLLDLLPFYIDDLPYYRRMAATGLAISMRHSFESSALLHRPGKEALLAMQSTGHSSLLSSLN